ncbi:MAG TPA: virulence factor [Candidatus Limnocylindrales bacterium]|nr:virulence factor [Candidatus Limnocylindrales bacterium]
MASLITIWWRDIPMQVIARDRRQAHKLVLHPRFQVAVDKAAMKAGKKAASDYVEEMRRSARECGDDLVAEASAEAQRLETAYPRDVLARLIEAGGVDSEAVAGRQPHPDPEADR